MADQEQPIYPTEGGTYHRDPATGDLTRVIPPTENVERKRESAADVAAPAAVPAEAAIAAPVVEPSLAAPETPVETTSPPADADTPTFARKGR